MSMLMALSLPREAASVTYLRALLDGLLASSGVTGDCRGELAIMVTEACTNAVAHGRGTGSVEVTIAMEPDRCVIEVGNSDGHFDEGRLGVGLPSPMAEGGRGLPLIGALADTVGVTHPRPGWVLLRMAKRLTHQPFAQQPLAQQPSAQPTLAQQPLAPQPRLRPA